MCSISLKFSDQYLVCNIKVKAPWGNIVICYLSEWHRALLQEHICIGDWIITIIASWLISHLSASVTCIASYFTVDCLIVSCKASVLLLLPLVSWKHCVLLPAAAASCHKLHSGLCLTHWDKWEISPWIKWITAQGALWPIYCLCVCVREGQKCICSCIVCLAVWLAITLPSAV